MAAKLTRLTHKIAIQLQLVAESVCNSHSRRPVRKLFDTPSYKAIWKREWSRASYDSVWKRVEV